MEMYKEIYVVFMFAHATLVLQPMNPGAILILNYYYLRNTFCKAIAAIEGDSSDESEINRLKNFQREFQMPLRTFLRILDVIMNIFDSWKKAKISTNVNRSLGEIDSNLL